MAHSAPGMHFRKGLSLMEVMALFPDEEAAVHWFEAVYWPRERTCGKCGSPNTCEARHKTMPYWCSDCHSYFSVKTGTPLASSKIPRDIDEEALPHLDRVLRPIPRLWPLVVRWNDLVRSQDHPKVSATTNRLEGWFGRLKPRARLTRLTGVGKVNSGVKNGPGSRKSMAVPCINCKHDTGSRPCFFRPHSMRTARPSPSTYRSCGPARSRVWPCGWDHPGPQQLPERRPGGPDGPGPGLACQPPVPARVAP